MSGRSGEDKFILDDDSNLDLDEDFVIEDDEIVKSEGEGEGKSIEDEGKGVSVLKKPAESSAEGPKSKKRKRKGDADVGLDSSQKTLQSENSFSLSDDWSELHLCKPLLKALNELQFEKPTPIQRDAIPLALQGRDILGTAQTGSGKTAAFLLPVLERLSRSPGVQQRRKRSDDRIVGGQLATKALVLLPTRELAVQCYDMLKVLAKFTCITQALVTGGMNQRSQEQTLRQYPDIVIATPGRILDLLLNSPNVHVELLEIVILDEADRLLELGFKDEILNHCSKSRQTMLFSATLSENIKDLAVLSLRRPLRVEVAGAHTLPPLLEQALVPIETPDKIGVEVFKEAVLLHLTLDIHKESKTIVFFRTKKATHRAALIFSFLNVDHAELHGNLPQNKRLEALERFHNDPKTRFLLCSELAARGLDISDIDLVINFTVPPEASRYIHQVGRTARIGRKGVALTFYLPEEKLAIKRIIRAANKNSKSSILKRDVNQKSAIKWAEEIKKLEPEIKLKLKEEHEERDFRVTEMEANKAINSCIHKNQILLRPKKTWIAKRKLSQ